MGKDSPILLIVESPKKARTISKFLGKKYIVRSTVGHIIDLAKTGKDKLGVNLEKDFKPDYVVIPEKLDKIKAIVDSARQCKEILLAPDPDREGEAIAWHVLSQVEKLNKPVKRVLFHEITNAGIRKGLANPRELDNNLYAAQQARRVLDRIVGFLVSKHLMNAFDDKLSAGRVQSVCLKLVTDREKEIKDFVPEKFWDLFATLSKDKNVKNFFCARYPTRITSQSKATKVENDLKSCKKFIIKSIDKKEKLRNSYPPFTTSTLQQAGAVRFRFAASRTMKSAQNLYEQGQITYIRSDSVRSSPESIKEVREWIASNNYEVPSKSVIYKNKNAGQDAHEAIRPTDVSARPSAFIGTDDDKKIYKIIWERFIASQMKPAKYDTATITVLADKHLLKANGKILTYPGWLAVSEDFDKGKDKDVKLPNLSIGDQVYLIPPGVENKEKATQPPPRFNDGSIIKELERKGIGRPSTYAAIISKITNRNYVERIKNNYVATELGINVVNNLSTFFSFMNYDYTKDMEKRLDDVSDGKLTYKEMMEGFFNSFKKELKKAYMSHYKDSGHKCNLCDSVMLLKHSQYGYYIACSGYPECSNIKGVELDGDKVIIREKHIVLEGIDCPKCNSGMVRRDGKFGPFHSCSRYPKCLGSRKIPFGKKCSKCNIHELYMTVFNEEPKLACMGYPYCQNIEAIPEGTKIDWIPPEKLQPKKRSRKIEKIINK